MTSDRCHDVFLQYAAVPEPGTWLLLAIGSLCVIGYRRFRSR
jgi:hypothetical protein